jgi:hypothetical protein
MFRIKFLVIVLFLSSTAAAQTVKVNKESIKLKGVNAEGYEVVLDGTYGEVQSQLTKYLKPIGKIKKSDEADVITTPIINTKTYSSPIYVVARDKGQGSAWIGVKAAEWTSNKDQILKEIEKLVYDFGVAFYRDKIQSQIDESMRALQAVERQQQRLLNQNKEFANRLGDNKNQKIQLEKSLENNKMEFDALNKKIAQNKKDQDSVAQAGEQIKKVIEMQKDKQRKVN